MCAAGNGASSPCSKRLFGGCHLTKPIVELLITAAGFTITDLDVFYQKGAPKFGGRRLPRNCAVPGDTWCGHPSR